MPLSKEQQQALDRLPPPASLDRITRFLSDLGAQGSEPLGTSGRSAQSLAASLAERAQSYSARQTSGWVAILMDRYQIKVGEIQEFALWFVRRQEIFTRTADLVERAPDPVLARHSAPDQAPDQVLARPPAASPGLMPPDADGPAPGGYSAPSRRMTLRRQAVAAAPAVAPPLSDWAPGFDALDTTGTPDTTDGQTRRRPPGTPARPATAPPRGRRIERGPVPMGADVPPGDAPQQEAPPGEAPPHGQALPGGPDTPPAARRRFQLVPNMVTRPAFVANVGLAGMLAGLSLTPATVMTQDAPFMALATPPMSGAGLMPGAGPMGVPPPYSPLGGIAPPMAPPFVPMGAPPFTPTVVPMVPAAAAPLPSAVWLGMPSTIPSPLAAVPSAPAAGTMNSPMALDAPTPGIASPTPPPVDMNLLPGMSPETLGVQTPPSPRTIGTHPPLPALTRQTLTTELPPNASLQPDASLQSNAPAKPLPPTASSLLPPTVLPMPVVLPQPGAALELPPLLLAPASAAQTPSMPALIGLVAASAAMAAERLRSHQPPATPGEVGATARHNQLPALEPPLLPSGTSQPVSSLLTAAITSTTQSPPAPGLLRLAADTTAPTANGRSQTVPSLQASVEARRFQQADPSRMGSGPRLPIYPLILPSAPSGAQNPTLPAPTLLGLVAGSAALAAVERLGPSQGHTEANDRRVLPIGSSLVPRAASLTPVPLFRGESGPIPPGRTALTGAAHLEATSAQADPFAVTPEMGQLTLISPPLQIASAQAERGGITTAVDWRTLAGGTGPLDEGGMARLKQALPAQASVLYPALPPGSLGQGAVNLPLSLPLIQSLLHKGYGDRATLGNGAREMAIQAADRAASVGGGKPPATPLQARLVPGPRPAGVAPGIFGSPAETAGGAGALAETGKGQAARGGVLDFLGLPVRLAPSLSGRSDLAHETALRGLAQGPVRPQRILRPDQFTPLRNRLFPAFNSMTVEPDRAAWRKAAPSFGLRDARPTTLLSPDARVPVQTPTSPQAPSRSRPPASSPSAAIFAGRHSSAPHAPLLTSTGHKSLAALGYPALPGALHGHGLRVPSGAHPGPDGTQSAFGGAGSVPRRTSYQPFAGHHPLVYPWHRSLAGADQLANTTRGSNPLESGPGHHLPSRTPHHLLSGKSHDFSRVHAAKVVLPAHAERLHTGTRVPHSLPGAHGGNGAAQSLSLPTPSHHSLPQHHRTGSLAGHPLSALSGSSHSPSVFGHVTPHSGVSHFSAGPTHGRTTHGIAPGIGSLLPRHLAAKPRTHSGAFTSSTVPGASIHLGRRPLLSAAGATARTLGHRPAVSGTFTPGSRHSDGYAQPLPVAAHPWGDTSGHTTLHPASPAGVSSGTSFRAPRDYRGGSQGWGGSPSSTLTLPHQTAGLTRLPDSRITTPHAATRGARAGWPVSPLPSGGRRRGAGVAGGFDGPAPVMRLAPARPPRRHGADAAPVIIQRSETTSAAPAPARGHTAQAHAQAPAGPSGATAGEVNALAGEVWSLIKRRLMTEAERRGRA